jgi:hypothetical protein
VSYRVLTLLPHDFPRCICGSHRLDHYDDIIRMSTGQCGDPKCKCRGSCQAFRADTDQPRNGKKRTRHA